MRELIDLLESIIDEAKLSASQISKYPERFDAFITHIQDGKPFYTEAGDEVTSPEKLILPSSKKKVRKLSLAKLV